MSRNLNAKIYQNNKNSRSRNLKSSKSTKRKIVLEKFFKNLKIPIREKKQSRALIAGSQ